MMAIIPVIDPAAAGLTRGLDIRPSSIESWLTLVFNDVCQELAEFCCSVDERREVYRRITEDGSSPLIVRTPTLAPTLARTRVPGRSADGRKFYPPRYSAARRSPPHAPRIIENNPSQSIREYTSALLSIYIDKC